MMREEEMVKQENLFDSKAAGWDDEARRVKLAAEVAAAVLAEVRPHPGARVLEFGCGTGLVTMALSPHVGEIVAVDTSEGMLAVLREKVARLQASRVRPLLLDFRQGERPDGDFDLVVTSMTLHHVPDIAPLIGFFRELLRPGGVLAVADLDPDRGGFHDSPEGVAHEGFDRGMLRGLLAGAGFAELRDSTVGSVAKIRDGAARNFTVFLITAVRR